MEIRELTDNDWPAYELLIKEQKTFFGMSDESFLEGIIKHSDSLAGIRNMFFIDPNTNYRAFGCFENDELLSAINVQFSDALPFWILRRMVVKEELKGNKKSMESMSQLMTHIVTFAEERGFFQHYNLIPAKYKNAHEKLWSKLESRKGYQLIEVELVPAGKKPQFQFFWNSLFGRMTYPIDTVIRMSVKVN